MTRPVHRKKDPAKVQAFRAELRERLHREQIALESSVHLRAMITLPPCSPELNPLGKLRDVIKDHLCNRARADLEVLMEAINAVLAEYRTTSGTWQFGVVMPVRAGLSPVRTAERVGEHSGLAEYACVKIMPRFARRSTFGVL